MSESDIRNLNQVELSIYRVIYKFGPISKNDIASHTHVSLATISRVINNLEKRNVVEAQNKGEAGGRVALRYIVKSEKHVVFGAFICFEVFGIGLCDINGNILSKEIQTLTAENRPDEIISFFHSFINRTITERSLEKDEILGIGIAVLGPILKDKGIIYNPAHLDHSIWNNTPIKDLMEIKAGIPTFVDNLAEVALIGEIFRDIEVEDKNVAYIWIDRGIGCGVYSNGALGFGNIDVSSNIGHMIIDFKGDRCICGKYGCLETYASINSIYKRLKRIVETVPQLSEAEQQQCYNDIWNCCPELLQVRHIIEQNGEKVAAYLEELEQAFTSALINFVYLFNANIIYYGGRTVEQLSTPIQKAFNNVMDDSSSQFYRDLQFRKSDISEKLLIRGASYHVINKYVHLIR